MAFVGLTPSGLSSVDACRLGCDWEQPWLAPYAAEGLRVAGAQQAGQRLCDALAPPPGTAVRFVPQHHLPEGTAYEAHIFETGTVPTRENLHDLFNGLCWHRFPLTKRRLNRLQAGEIAQMGVQRVRGPVRDALTLFDENAALLQAPDALWAALLERDWQRLFLDLRPLWAQARLVLFGHALLEKLVEPYKSITAHVYRAPVPLGVGSDLLRWDAWLAEDLSAQGMAGKPFTPLPVLGVPGWWPENQAPAFYADAGVFRPRRSGERARPAPGP